MTHIGLVFKYAFSDLGRSKLRSIIGILGVAISVGLLAIVLFLSDTITATYVGYMSTDAGDQDMVIDVRHYNGEPDDRSDYFKYKPVIEAIQDSNSSEIIDKYIYRMEVQGVVNASAGYGSKEVTNEQTYTRISGIDVSNENNLNYGTFIEPDVDAQLTIKSLGLYHCAMYYQFANGLKYAEGDTIEVNMSLTHGDKVISKTKKLYIDQIFDYNLKWPGSYRNSHLIVVDIETLYNTFGLTEFNERCNTLILTFKESDSYYDVGDIDGSEATVKNIANDIQAELGMNQYNIDLPKLTMLGFSQFITMFVSIIFIFVSMIAMIISGVLINGILKTSVEEKIREFGIFRTLGSHKNYNLAIVIVQGFLLCNFGSISGIIGGYFLTQFVLLPFANTFLLGGGGFLGENIAVTFNFTSVLIAYSIGVIVGIVVSISPALKVMRLQLIESIHPYRHEDTLYHLRKSASVNYKLILVGLILSLNGGFIFFIIPRLLISMNIGLLISVLIIILLVFLIGITLGGLGIMPVVLNIVIGIFKPVAKKLHSVIKIFVYRYQRRNTSTIIIFALSFSFIMFTSTVISDISGQQVTNVRVRFGADLVLETDGWDSEYDINPSRIMTTEFKEELMKIQGIESVSSVLAYPYQLSQVYAEEGKSFSASIGDYAGLSTQAITLIGIDKSYYSTVNQDYIFLEQGGIKESFDQLFANKSKYTCIISEGISSNLKLGIGDKVRMIVERGDESEIYEFTIVDFASTLAGFSGLFGGSGGGMLGGGGGGLMGGGGGGGGGAGSGSGVLISQDAYLDIMDIPKISYVDKTFIQLQENINEREVELIVNEINVKYNEYYDFNIYNVERRVTSQLLLFSVIDALFTLILMCTVVICLFGLLSSSYSTILERKKEIGIVRTLGLKGKDINRMFVIEALIIMYSSGIVGVITGTATGWLLSSSIGMFSNMPWTPIFSWTNFYMVFIVSTIFVLVGMHFLLRKVKKKKIIDIYREN